MYHTELRIYPGDDGKFTLCENKGDGCEYEKGEYALTDLTWDDSTRTLTIAKRRSSYLEMITSRRFNIVIVNNHNGRSDTQSAVLHTVEYNGEELSVKL